jgi:hypothetical protein
MMVVDNTIWTPACVYDLCKQRAKLVESHGPVRGSPSNRERYGAARAGKSQNTFVTKATG